MSTSMAQQPRPRSRSSGRRRPSQRQQQQQQPQRRVSASWGANDPPPAAGTHDPFDPFAVTDDSDLFQGGGAVDSTGFPTSASPQVHLKAGGASSVAVSPDNGGAPAGNRSGGGNAGRSRSVGGGQSRSVSRSRSRGGARGRDTRKMGGGASGDNAGVRAKSVGRGGSGRPQHQHQQQQPQQQLQQQQQQSKTTPTLTPQKPTIDAATAEPFISSASPVAPALVTPRKAAGGAVLTTATTTATTTPTPPQQSQRSPSVSVGNCGSRHGTSVGSGSGRGTSVSSGIRGSARKALQQHRAASGDVAIPPSTIGDDTSGGNLLIKNTPPRQQQVQQQQQQQQQQQHRRPQVPASPMSVNSELLEDAWKDVSTTTNGNGSKNNRSVSSGNSRSIGGGNRSVSSNNSRSNGGGSRNRQPQKPKQQQQSPQSHPGNLQQQRKEPQQQRQQRERDDDESSAASSVDDDWKSAEAEWDLVSGGSRRASKQNPSLPPHQEVPLQQRPSPQGQQKRHQENEVVGTPQKQTIHPSPQNQQTRQPSPNQQQPRQRQQGRRSPHQQRQQRSSQQVTKPPMHRDDSAGTSSLSDDDSLFQTDGFISDVTNDNDNGAFFATADTDDDGSGAGGAPPPPPPVDGRQGVDGGGGGNLLPPYSQNVTSPEQPQSQHPSAMPTSEDGDDAGGILYEFNDSKEITPRTKGNRRTRQRQQQQQQRGGLPPHPIRAPLQADAPNDNPRRGAGKNPLPPPVPTEQNSVRDPSFESPAKSSRAGAAVRGQQNAPSPGGYDSTSSAGAEADVDETPVRHNNHHSRFPRTTPTVNHNPGATDAAVADLVGVESSGQPPQQQQQQQQQQADAPQVAADHHAEGPARRESDGTVTTAEEAGGEDQQQPPRRNKVKFDETPRGILRNKIHQYEAHNPQVQQSASFDSFNSLDDSGTESEYSFDDSYDSYYSDDSRGGDRKGGKGGKGKSSKKELRADQHTVEDVLSDFFLIGNGGKGGKKSKKKSSSSRKKSGRKSGGKSSRTKEKEKDKKKEDAAADAEAPEASTKKTETTRKNQLSRNGKEASMASMVSELTTDSEICTAESTATSTVEPSTVASSVGADSRRTLDTIRSEETEAEGTTAGGGDGQESVGEDTLDTGTLDTATLDTATLDTATLDGTIDTNAGNTLDDNTLDDNTLDDNTVASGVSGITMGTTKGRAKDTDGCNRDTSIEDAIETVAEPIKMLGGLMCAGIGAVGSACGFNMNSKNLDPMNMVVMVENCGAAEAVEENMPGNFTKDGDETAKSKEGDAAESKDDAGAKSKENADPNVAEGPNDAVMSWEGLSGMYERMTGQNTPALADKEKSEDHVTEEKENSAVGETPSGEVVADAAEDEAAGLVELVKCAARTKHEHEGLVFQETYDIDVVNEVKFLVVTTGLPLGVLFKENSGGCYISRVFKASKDTFSNSNGDVAEVCDQLTAINGESAMKKTVAEVCSIMSAAPNPNQIELSFLRYTGPLQLSPEEKTKPSITNDKSPTRSISKTQFSLMGFSPIRRGPVAKPETKVNIDAKNPSSEPSPKRVTPTKLTHSVEPNNADISSEPKKAKTKNASFKLKWPKKKKKKDSFQHV